MKSELARFDGAQLTNSTQSRSSRVHPTNRDPIKTKVVNSVLGRGVVSGVDWLQVGVKGGYRSRLADRLVEVMERIAIVREDGGNDFKATIGGEEGRITCVGRRLGGYYPIFFKGARWSVGFCCKAPFAETVVVISGRDWWGYDHKGVWKSCADWLERIGVRSSSTSVQRLDLMCDVDGSPAWFGAAHRDRRIRGHIRSWGSWQSSGRTWSIGKHPCMMRVYDKLAELSSKTIDFTEDYLACHWDERPERVTRFEWELGGEWLRDRGLQDVTSVMENLADILWTLMGEYWVTTNKERCRDAPVQDQWSELRLVWCGQMGGGGSLHKVDRMPPDVSKLLKQWAGLWGTIKQYTRYSDKDMAELLAGIQRQKGRER